jgi:hypothetical protein
LCGTIIVSFHKKTVMRKILLLFLLAILAIRLSAQDCELKTSGIYHYQDDVGLNYYLYFSDNDTVWILTSVNNLQKAFEQFKTNPGVFQKTSYQDSGCEVYFEIPYNKKSAYEYKGKYTDNDLYITLTPPKKVSKNIKNMQFEYTDFGKLEQDGE